jgi:hypothetical protein
LGGVVSPGIEPGASSPQYCGDYTIHCLPLIKNPTWQLRSWAWWSRQESNLDLELRKLLYYPLYDETGAAKIGKPGYWAVPQIQKIVLIAKCWLVSRKVAKIRRRKGGLLCAFAPYAPLREIKMQRSTLSSPTRRLLLHFCK